MFQVSGNIFCVLNWLASLISIYHLFTLSCIRIIQTVDTDLQYNTIYDVMYAIYILIVTCFISLASLASIYTLYFSILSMPYILAFQILIISFNKHGYFENLESYLFKKKFGFSNFHPYSCPLLDHGSIFGQNHVWGKDDRLIRNANKL